MFTLAIDVLAKEIYDHDRGWRAATALCRVQCKGEGIAVGVITEPYNENLSIEVWQSSMEI